MKMQNVFQVGDRETHHVEVEQPFIGRVLTVKVDGKVIVSHKAKPFKLAYTIPFSIGVDEIHNAELRVNYLTSKYEAYVDGKLYVAYLFPQAIGYNALLVALMAFIMSYLSCWALYIGYTFR